MACTLQLKLVFMGRTSLSVVDQGRVSGCAIPPPRLTVVVNGIMALFDTLPRGYCTLHVIRVDRIVYVYTHGWLNSRPWS